jgi:hypothetical protein
MAARNYEHEDEVLGRIKADGTFDELRHLIVNELKQNVRPPLHIAPLSSGVYNLAKWGSTLLGVCSVRPIGFRV